MKALSFHIPCAYLDYSRKSAWRLPRRFDHITPYGYSSVYETEPWGFESRNKFLNMAMMLYTEMDPLRVLGICKDIEQELGRERHGAERDGDGRRIYSSRTIDIDILLFYKDGEPVVMDNEELTIPHPRMAERLFAIEPLSEIAGELRHPVVGTSIKEILSQLKQR